MTGPGFWHSFWESAAGFVSILAVLGAFAAFMYFRYVAYRRILQRWALQHDFQPLDYSPRFFLRGPFFLASSSQMVYRVTVRDPAGLTRRGWVKCGHWLAGALSDEVAVRWDQ